MEVLVDDVVTYMLVHHCDLLVVLTMALTCKGHFALVSGREPWRHPMTTDKRDWHVFNKRASGSCRWRHTSYDYFWMAEVFFEFGSLDLLKRVFSIRNIAMDTTKGCMERLAWRKAPISVAARGDVALLDWMALNGGSFFDFGFETARRAAQGGHWPVLQWLAKNCYHSFTSGRIVADACVSGNLPMIQWMVRECADMRRDPNCLDYVEMTIKYGHFHVLQWFHSLKQSSPWKLSYPFEHEIAWATMYKQEAIRNFLLRTKEEMEDRVMRKVIHYYIDKDDE